MTAPRFAVGDRAHFTSSHWSVSEMSGQVVEIVELHETPHSWECVVANAAGKRWQAVSRELVPIL